MSNETKIKTFYNLFKASAVGVAVYAAKNLYDHHRNYRQYEKLWRDAGYEKAFTGYKDELTYEGYVPTGGALYRMKPQPQFGMWQKKSTTGKETFAKYDHDFKNRPEM